MKKLRKYGKAPFCVAVIHGGPGAAGEMAPVAYELSSGCGVLEPIQTMESLEAQVEELKTVLENHADLPVTLIGFSWGAWLSFIVAARYPAIIKKLILVASGPYEEKYAAGIHGTRLNRLSEQERAEFDFICRNLGDPAIQNKDTLFARLGTLASEADAYDPETDKPEEIESRADIFQGVWPDAADLRNSGKLLKLGNDIKCPVVAIHGDYDPHPAEGVQKPLAAVLKHFRFVLLKHCGHKPWIEHRAREEFFRILRQELL
ncbi:MAG: alpha/beta fold hydrolase [Phycisphaerae bacterium]|nr:alpha/beta hydrolase [Phycisphaerae bacterium]NIP54783.1 alpha/beta hydrolase [Phycisphaerae bacterium]NIS50495.1 alpha/beta hydrolase [Phycisphaerae bacterium]NIU11100.1 alpha/beta hydrolase [Phycisphaerae bacterium]NIU58986.1 alpha/beta fold hydrolase [Phycisphaerae bacterium]